MDHRYLPRKAVAATTEHADTVIAVIPPAPRTYENPMPCRWPDGWTRPARKEE